jgi:hypothetical protein
MGVLAYNLLHMIRQFYVWGEEVRRSMDWLIKRLIKVGVRISYQARRWYVHAVLRFAPGAPLPGAAGLDFISSAAVTCMGSKGCGVLKIQEKITFSLKLVLPGCG